MSCHNRFYSQQIGRDKGFNYPKKNIDASFELLAICMQITVHTKYYCSLEYSGNVDWIDVRVMLKDDDSFKAIYKSNLGLEDEEFISKFKLTIKSLEKYLLEEIQDYKFPEIVFSEKKEGGEKV